MSLSGVFVQMVVVLEIFMIYGYWAITYNLQLRVTYNQRQTVSDLLIRTSFTYMAVCLAYMQYGFI